MEAEPDISVAEDPHFFHRERGREPFSRSFDCSGYGLQNLVMGVWSGAFWVEGNSHNFGFI